MRRTWSELWRNGREVAFAKAFSGPRRFRALVSSVSGPPPTRHRRRSGVAGTTRLLRGRDSFRNPARRPPGRVGATGRLLFWWPSSFSSGAGRLRRGSTLHVVMRRIARHLLALVAGLVLVRPAPASVAAVPDVLDRLAVRETVLDPEVADAEQIRPYASRDTVEWTIGAFGGAEFGITELAFLRTGIDWFVRDGFSLGLQLDVGGIRVGGTGYTGAIGSAARLRWHFLRSDSCTVFAASQRRHRAIASGATGSQVQLHGCTVAGRSVAPVRLRPCQTRFWIRVMSCDHNVPVNVMVVDHSTGAGARTCGWETGQPRIPIRVIAVD